MNEELYYRVLLAPHVSEKATEVNHKNGQYVFRVLPKATKKMITQAVEKLFKVKVTGVNIVNIAPEKFRNMRTGKKATRSGYKKAYVSLHAGQQIDFFVEGA